MKLIRRSVLLILILTGIAIAIGYALGYRIEDVKQYWVDISKPADDPPDQSNPTPTDSTTSPAPSNPLDKKVTNKGSYQNLLPLPKSPFRKIDSHARKSPTSVEDDISELAEYLSKIAKNDRERARSIFVWLAENIHYDAEGYNSGDYGATNAEGVLESRKSVCDGFSNLYLALGEEMGLEIKKVVGYARGYGHEPGSKMYKTNHAWNIVKFDEEWHVSDATWGEGFGENVNGKLKSTKKFNEVWFDVNPYEAIFSHMPENGQDAHVTPKIGLDKFNELPNISVDYFRLGFEAKPTYQKVYEKPSLKFPECFDVDTHVKANVAPKYGIIYIEKTYEFEFFIPRGIEMAIIDPDGQWKYFSRDNGIFKIEYSPTTSGEITVCVKTENRKNLFDPIMTYRVKASKTSS